MDMDTHATYRRLLQLALAQEQQHAIIALDADGRVMEWAGGAARVYGFTADEMIGRTMERLMSEDEVRRGEAAWSLKAARSYGYAEEDRWHTRKDGLRIWVSSVTSVLRDEGGGLAGYVKIARDRTDLRTQVESLQHRLEECERVEDRRHVVLGTLAHELRNPLQEIASAARIVRRVAIDDENIRMSVQIIERQVRFIDNLLRDLMESTRSAVGKARLHCDPVGLRKLLDDAIETCRGALDARRQALEVVVPGETQVEVDVVRMRQVIVNLLGNASKFSPEGARIWIKANVEAGELVLRVEDHGSGIPAELLPRIFDLFTQAGAEGEAAGHGLGLGLGVVKTLVEMHGGTVQARSEGAGRGTEIIVRVPARRPRAEAA
jgi:PAS domain S-box-containing protein